MSYIMKTFPAKYAGTCTSCNAAIKKGDPIGFACKRAYCAACVDDNNRAEGAARFDEEQYRSQYGGGY